MKRLACFVEVSLQHAQQFATNSIHVRLAHSHLRAFAGSCVADMIYNILVYTYFSM